MIGRTHPAASSGREREPMSDLAKCCMLSIVIHLGMLGLMLTFAANTVKHIPPVSIDFTLSSSPVFAQTPENTKALVSRPKQTLASQKPPTVAAQPTPIQQELARTETTPDATFTKHAAATPTPSAPSVGRALTQNNSGPVSTKQETQVVSTAARAAQTGDGGMTPGKAQQRYLKEHFTYIRDLIVKRLSYPHVARRMGWSGRVVLAFVVAEDGSVRSIQVRESSGYSVLDNSAMETVKSVAPFPRPPVAAEIVMPVQFQLQ